jgi:hypothetical protein
MIYLSSATSYSTLRAFADTVIDYMIRFGYSVEIEHLMTLAIVLTDRQPRVQIVRESGI